jgi:hypothetical protein
MFSTVVKYWPAVVAGIYVVYVAASGQTAQLPAAISAFLAAAGLSHTAASAHSKIDQLAK